MKHRYYRALVMLGLTAFALGSALLSGDNVRANGRQPEPAARAPRRTVEPVVADRGWAGKWQSAADPHLTLTITASGAGLRGTQNRAISKGIYSRTELKNFKILSPTRVTCDGSGTYVDPEKTITCLSAFGMVLSGDSIAVTHTGMDRKFKWKPGAPPNEQTCMICVPKMTTRDTYRRVK